MNLGIWIALAAVIVALAGIAATIFAARQWGNRRRKIFFVHDSAPLLAVGIGDHHPLQVTYKGIPVEDPHHVTIRVGNVGPADIASEHFDAARSLVVRLNCTMYGLTRNSHPHNTVVGGIGADGVIELQPVLFRRGEDCAVEAVVRGEPRPVIDSPLIDTDVAEERGAAKQLIEQLAGVVVTVGLPFGVQVQLKR